VLVAPEDASIPSALLQKVDDGRVKWIKRAFQDDDLKSFGRDEVDNYVDAVFVTLGAQDPVSEYMRLPRYLACCEQYS
jgi:uroporphyrin-III C-methyltransferase